MPTPGSAAAQLERPRSKKLKIGEGPQATAFAAADGIDRGKREVLVNIILEGPGNDHDRHWYSAQAIQDGVLKFAGARSFLNHQTEAEAEARPEQDVKELSGWYKDLRLGRAPNPKLGGRIVAALQGTFVATESQAGNTALALAVAQEQWAQAYPSGVQQGQCFAGISINSGGMSDGTIHFNGEDWVNVVSFEDVRSADIVTRPGAGGAFLRLAESVWGVPHKTKEQDMKKKLRQLAVALEGAKNAARAEKDEKKRTALQETAKKLQTQFTTLLVQAGKAEQAREAEGREEEEEAEDEGEADPAAHMDAMKAHVPMQDGENDQQYTDRLNAIMGHAAGAAGAAKPGADGEAEGEEEEDESGLPPKGKGAQEPGQESNRGRHRETAAVRAFRQESPNLYKELMTTMREAVSVERSDFKGLKQRVDSLERENRALRLDKDLGMCEALLTEAGIPRKYLTAGDLVKLDESARKREISRWVAALEGGSARVFDGGGNPGGGEGGNTALVQSLEKAGI